MTAFLYSLSGSSCICIFKGQLLEFYFGFWLGHVFLFISMPYNFSVGNLAFVKNNHLFQSLPTGFIWEKTFTILSDLRF